MGQSGNNLAIDCISNLDIAEERKKLNNVESVLNILSTFSAYFQWEFFLAFLKKTSLFNKNANIFKFPGNKRHIDYTNLKRQPNSQKKPL